MFTLNGRCDTAQWSQVHFLEKKASSRTVGFKDIVAWLLHQGWVWVFILSKEKSGACCSHFPLLCEEMSSYLDFVVLSLEGKGEKTIAAAVTWHLNNSHVVHVHWRSLFQTCRFYTINSNLGQRYPCFIPVNPLSCYKYCPQHNMKNEHRHCTVHYQGTN